MTTSIRLATTAALAAAVLSPAWAGGMPAAEGPAPRALANARALEQADEAFIRARALCLKHPADVRAACLADARQAHAQAIVGAAGERLPAVQTQSSSVDRTGAAPVAVDERTPGVPARPAGVPETRR
ncbi:hypothetical protein [Ramlibacter rhizophilus]|uniref:UrcA family protein n=1 Tax=Ramlibacter rhizophilus TaxID=1781167 RepID=A0A4Z0C198_9BURK|nr:hypothetical protein [Ramlibacter rhizophilus]TFZ04280.1 hypothetical protein EZ242_00535 [Ramlibacter rhizophilus]